MEDKKSAVAERYQNRPPLRPLVVGKTVLMEPINSKTHWWREGTVNKKVKSRINEVASGEGKR